MEKNLIPDLLPAGAEDDELLQLLQRHYGSARSTSDNDVVYPNAEEFALRVHCKSRSQHLRDKVDEILA
jgi:hypothetical protein